jgi:YbbR domain-containing protein
MADLGTTPHSPSARRTQFAVRTVLAVLIGIGVWLSRTIIANPTIEAPVELSISVVGTIPEGVTLKPEPDTVSVTVRGRRESVQAESVKRYLRAEVRAEDLSPQGDGPVTIVGQAPGVDRLSCSPERVTLRTLDSKLVPVRVRITGPDAATVTAPTASPAEVKVTGPKDVIDRVIAVEAQVRAPSLARQGWDDSYDIALLAEGERVLDPAQVTFEPSRVRVNAEASSVEVTVKATTVGSLAVGRRLGAIRIEPAKVRVSGPPEKLAGLTEIETAPIDLAGHDATFVTSVSLRPPEGLTPYRESTVQVTVEVLGP